MINNIDEICGLLHNHPCGDPTPLRADIQMTQAIIKVVKPLGLHGANAGSTRSAAL